MASVPVPSDERINEEALSPSTSSVRFPSSYSLVTLKYESPVKSAFMVPVCCIRELVAKSPAIVRRDAECVIDDSLSKRITAPSAKNISLNSFVVTLPRAAPSLAEGAMALLSPAGVNRISAPAVSVIFEPSPSIFSKSSAERTSPTFAPRLTSSVAVRLMSTPELSVRSVLFDSIFSAPSPKISPILTGIITSPVPLAVRSMLLPEASVKSVPSPSIVSPAESTMSVVISAAEKSRPVVKSRFS